VPDGADGVQEDLRALSDFRSRGAAAQAKANGAVLPFDWKSDRGKDMGRRRDAGRAGSTSGDGEPLAKPRDDRVVRNVGERDVEVAREACRWIPLDG
jgi:hypothetical protein